MKWRFTLKGTATHHGTVSGGRDAEATVSWTLGGEPALPAGATRHLHGREALLKFARFLCACDGGRILVVEAGQVTQALEWRDAGELDAEASGVWYEKKLDPRDFRGMA